MGASARRSSSRAARPSRTTSRSSGSARLHREKGGHVVTASTEHRAVLDACRQLEREGVRGHVPRAREGHRERSAPSGCATAITDRTVLVSLMLANNEIGTIQTVAAIGAICRESGVLFHTDAVQGFGKIPFDVQAMHVDLASVSAHKIYGPKGVGALYVRARASRACGSSRIVFGGGHERGMRSGTLERAGNRRPRAGPPRSPSPRWPRKAGGCACCAAARRRSARAPRRRDPERRRRCRTIEADGAPRAGAPTSGGCRATSTCRLPGSTGRRCSSA